jgi:hypothetical protein
VAHGARPCSGDALQLITGHHHHRHALIATGAAEVGGQIGCRLKVLLTAEAFGTLQHHVAARAFLSMEPEIAAAGLPQADPFILAMVATHLQAQSSGTAEFEG